MHSIGELSSGIWTLCLGRPKKDWIPSQEGVYAQPRQGQYRRIFKKLEVTQLAAVILQTFLLWNASGISGERRRKVGVDHLVYLPCNSVRKSFWFYAKFFALTTVLMMTLVISWEHGTICPLEPAMTSRLKAWEFHNQNYAWMAKLFVNLLVQNDFPAGALSYQPFRGASAVSNSNKGGLWKSPLAWVGMEQKLRWDKMNVCGTTNQRGSLGMTDIPVSEPERALHWKSIGPRRKSSWKTLKARNGMHLPLLPGRRIPDIELPAERWV